MDYSYDPSLYSNTYQPNFFASTGFMIGGLIGLILFIVTYWKIFVKAGQSGWAILIPLYNVYILLKVVRRPGWWLLLFLVPLVNFVVSILISLDLAKVFGRSTAFGIFLNWLLHPIGPLIIAFGKSTYQK